MIKHRHELFKNSFKFKLLAAVFVVISAISCGKPGDPAQQGADKENSPVVEPPLSRAVIHGDLTEITSLLNSGADINAKDALGRTPLHMAAFYGRVKTSELLIDKGAELNARDRVGMTPLHIAVISGGRQQVEALLDRKADITVQTDSGQTVLHLSAGTGQPKLTKFLIDRGADPRIRDADNKLPIDYAIQNKHPQTTLVLKQNTPKN